MEANTTQQDRSRVEVALNEPHFDEEATLLSARPVVPLEEVKAGARSRRRLAFILSILIAIAAGALGGTLFYKYGGQQRATEIETASRVPEQPSEQTAAVADVGGAQIDPQANAVSITEDKPSETVSAETTDSVASTTVRPSSEAAPRILRSEATRPRSDESSRKDRVDRENSEDSERELRRAERKEARRLRREAQREARRGRDTADDLLRIREIFEGSPRP
jgi:hypothetical protein